VPRPTYPRTVPEFNRFFPDEQTCLDYLAACRWPDGFRCPRCGHDEAFVLPRPAGCTGGWAWRDLFNTTRSSH